MKLVIFLIIASQSYCIDFTSAKMFTTDIGSSTTNNFADCILNITRRYFNNIRPVAIQMSSLYDKKYLTNNNEINLLYILSKENEFSRVTLGLIENMGNPSVYSFKTGNAMKYSSYLLILSGNSLKENFHLAFKMTQRIFIGKNEKSKLIMVLTNTLKTPYEQEKHAKKLLQVSFRVGFVYSIVVAHTTIHGSKLQQLKIFGWNPNLQTNICSIKLDTIDLLDTWNFEQRTFVLNADLFPEYRFVNMKGCLLFQGVSQHYPFIYKYIHNRKVTTGGSFYKFMLILEKLLNCNIRLHSEDMPIYTRHAMFPVLISTDVEFNDCGWVYPYYSNDFYWYVPYPLKIPRWRSLIRAFKPEMWVFVSLAFIFGTLILFYLHKIEKKSDSKNNSISLVDHFQSSLKTYLGISTSVDYRGKTAIATFILWLFYCLVINTAYQSSLFGLIVNPGHYPAIKTLKELDESGLEKVMAYYTHEHLDDSYGLYYRKYPVCANAVYDCFKKVTKERLQTVLASNYEGKKAMEEFTEGGLPQIVPVKEKYFTLYNIVEINGLSCVLQKPMEITLRRLVSGGLIERWNDEFSIVEKRRVTLNNNTSLVSVFGLSHLYGVFYICMFGFMLAVICFITEILLPAFYRDFT